MINPKLEKIRNQVITCTKCSLCENRKNAVPGKGDPNADVIFIGEAPGRNEDAKGEPFVGAAGKILSETLESVGINRESVYITNIVKCRPPKNRIPTKIEKDACIKYLESEFEIINPKIVCVMGNTAFNSILDGKDITKHRGEIVQKNKRLYFITIHPAATIYNRKLLPELKKDLKKLANTISNIKHAKIINVK